MLSLKEIIQKKDVLVAAHRGVSSQFPENTIAAFNAAVNLGADMIEFDIQFSKDGQIVVYHDDMLRNTNQLISDINYNELENYDNGSWFSEKFENERIPLVNEIVKTFREQVYFSIEIKPFFSTQTQIYIDNLIAILIKWDAIPNAVIGSFDEKNISYIKSTYSNTNTAAIALPNSNLLPIDYKNKSNCDAIICSITELSDEFSRNALENNIFIGIYGAETKEDVNKCLKNKVKVIGTDFPERIIEFLR